MAREFPLGDVLTITTGRLVSTRGIGAVYDILNYMTGDDLSTQQLPRAADECRPHLIAQHPQLGSPLMDIAVADLDSRLSDNLSFCDAAEVVCDWLSVLTETYGETFPVEPIPARDHAVIGPVIEAEMMCDGLW